MSTSRTLEGDSVQVVEDNLLHLLVHLLLLPENHVALAFNRRLLELGVLENVADDVDRLADVLAEALRVVHSLFTGSVRVQVRTEVLDLQLESVLTPSVGTLESHVFQEMCRAICLVGLRPRAGIYPDTYGGCLSVRVGFGGDSQAIGESGGFSHWT